MKGWQGQQRRRLPPAPAPGQAAALLRLQQARTQQAALPEMSGLLMQALPSVGRSCTQQQSGRRARSSLMRQPQSFLASQRSSCPAT